MAEIVALQVSDVLRLFISLNTNDRLCSREGLHKKRRDIYIYTYIYVLCVGDYIIIVRLQTYTYIYIYILHLI